MVEVDVINPEDRKRALKCSECGMTYSPEEYKILFDREKLIYFKFKPKGSKRSKIYCHGCLLSVIHKNYPFDDLNKGVGLVIGDVTDSLPSEVTNL